MVLKKIKLKFFPLTKIKFSTLHSKKNFSKQQHRVPHGCLLQNYKSPTKPTPATHRQHKVHHLKPTSTRIVSPQEATQQSHPVRPKDEFSRRIGQVRTTPASSRIHHQQGRHQVAQEQQQQVRENQETQGQHRLAQGHYRGHHKPAEEQRQHVQTHHRQNAVEPRQDTEHILGPRLRGRGQVFQRTNTVQPMVVQREDFSNQIHPMRHMGHHQFNPVGSTHQQMVVGHANLHREFPKHFNDYSNK